MKKNALSGSLIYTRVFQVSCLLPLVYIFAVSGSGRIITEKGILSFLFDLGVSLLPRWLSLGLSCIYRLLGNEVILYFLLALIALAFGFIAKPLFSGRKSGAVRIIFLVLICADLILRFVPLGFRPSFGLTVTVISFAVRAVCAGLLLFDIITAKKKPAEE